MAKKPITRTCQWRDFFEDNNGQFSMSRLLCFMSFFPATYVLVSTRSDTALGWYLATYAAAYVGGKMSEKMGGKNVVP